MKKLMYLLVVGVLFTFTACGGGDCATDCAKECCVAAECADDCAKACCLGCQATDGDPKCKEDHSCCDSVNNVDIEYTEDEIAEKAHGHNHDHGEGEGHDHDH